MMNEVLFKRLLRAAALVFPVVSFMHIAFGLHAEVMLGAELDDAALNEPSLDSQNRFYGAVFAIYGVILWMAASDLKRYGPILKAALWVFFIAGLARFLTIVQLGWPAPAVVILLGLELVLPLIMLVWQHRL